MSNPAMVIKVSFSGKRRAPEPQTDPPPTIARSATTRAQGGVAGEPTRLARLLALAHYVARLRDEGEVKGTAEVARRLGLTRARLTQVANLALLAPEIQARILAGELKTTERRLRRVAIHSRWATQSLTLQSLDVSEDTVT